MNMRPWFASAQPNDVEQENAVIVVIPNSQARVCSVSLFWHETLEASTFARLYCLTKQTDCLGTCTEKSKHSWFQWLIPCSDQIPFNCNYTCGCEERVSLWRKHTICRDNDSCWRSGLWQVQNVDKVLRLWVGLALAMGVRDDWSNQGTGLRALVWNELDST